MQNGFVVGGDIIKSQKGNNNGKSCSNYLPIWYVHIKLRKPIFFGHVINFRSHDWIIKQILTELQSYSSYFQYNVTLALRWRFYLFKFSANRLIQDISELTSPQQDFLFTSTCRLTSSLIYCIFYSILLLFTSTSPIK